MIADNVIKNIEKTFKNCSGVASTTSSYVSNNTKSVSANVKSKKSSSVHGQQLLPFKCSESQQIPNNQNSKPMAKKVSKKDPVPTVTSSMGNKLSPNPPLAKSCTNVEV